MLAILILVPCAILPQAKPDSSSYQLAALSGKADVAISECLSLMHVRARKTRQHDRSNAKDSRVQLTLLVKSMHGLKPAKSFERAHEDLARTYADALVVIQGSLASNDKWLVNQGITMFQKEVVPRLRIPKGVYSGLFPENR